MKHLSLDRMRSGRWQIRAACTALTAVLSIPAFAADAGFTVEGSFTSNTYIFSSTETNDTLASLTHSYDVLGPIISTITPAQPGIPGLIEVTQTKTTHSYQENYDNYSIVFTGSPTVTSDMKYIDFTGLVSVAPANVLAGNSLAISLTVDGSYTSSGLTGIPGLPSLDTGPTMPSLYYRTNGGTWQALTTSLSFNGGGYSASASTSSLVAVGSFEILAATTGNMSLTGLRIGASSHTTSEESLSTTNTVLASTPIPALAPVPEPKEWAMLLSGLLLMGAVIKRRTNV